MAPDVIKGLCLMLLAWAVWTYLYEDVWPIIRDRKQLAEDRRRVKEYLEKQPSVTERLHAGYNKRP